MFFEASLRIGQRLTERCETVSVAESSTGGLISANLLSVPGASRYFQGGSVVYTLASRRAYLDLEKSRVEAMQPLTQAMVLEFARAARLKLNTTWGIAELGAAGPTGTPYGHDAGTSVIGISGPLDRACLIETRATDRGDNMQHFSEQALQLFEAVLYDASQPE